jgi:hypothetical protein
VRDVSVQPGHVLQTRGPAGRAVMVDAKAASSRPGARDPFGAAGLAPTLSFAPRTTSLTK